LLTKIDNEWSKDASRWLSCSRAESPLLQFVNQGMNDVHLAVFNDSVESIASLMKKKRKNKKGDKEVSACPELWAYQSNKLDCTNVWVGVHSGQDLEEEYYANNVEVLEKQLAAGGLRLAAVLNSIFY
jgi:hypothetical protein